jgi:hypothetical protein
MAKRYSGQIPAQLLAQSVNVLGQGQLAGVFADGRYNPEALVENKNALLKSQGKNPVRSFIVVTDHESRWPASELIHVLSLNIEKLIMEELRLRQVIAMQA